MTLRAQKAWKYVVGTIPEPKDRTAKKTEWLEAHDLIIGAMGTIVEAHLQHELENITSVKLAWEKLKEKTHLKGMIAKLESMTLAIRNRIDSTVPASMTITEIKDALGCL
jgi:hypothetical protein